MPVTYYVVVPFDFDESGDLRAGEAKEAASARAAERSASASVPRHAGAVAFSRTGDSATGDFENAVILAQFGQVDLSALSA